jgi:CBS domain-containing protein
MKRWNVGDVMTRDVVSVRTGTTYREIVQTLAEHGISAAPVLDRQGRVAGVVSEADLLYKVEFSDGEEPPKVFEGRSVRRSRVKSGADRAADLMTAPAITATPETSLARAAKLLDTNDIKRLPVVDTSGNLVGIVSRTDLLRIYTRSDEQITEDIQQELLSQTLGIEPQLVDVTVDSGVVMLRGKVDRKTTAKLIVHLCSGAAGAAAVNDELTWEFDDTKISDPAYYRAHPFSGPPPQ